LSLTAVAWLKAPPGKVPRSTTLYLGSPCAPANPIIRMLPATKLTTRFMSYASTWSRRRPRKIEIIERHRIRARYTDAVTPPGNDVSPSLQAWSAGDTAALDKLPPIVSGDLRRLASRYMKGERDGHSLQTTALVNEAYLRLVDIRQMQWQNRAHFFAVSAQLMRRILVDYARRHNLKRGGGLLQVSLPGEALVDPGPGPGLAALRPPPP